MRDKEGVQALRVTVTAPVVSFRDPLYSGVQVTLPCPPPATVGGMLAAAAGGWGQVDSHLSFAMTFYARGHGTDLETYHPLEESGKAASPAPRNREFLADVTLQIWLFEAIDRWFRRFRRPRWPLRLGRSQDLVGIALDKVPVQESPGVQGSAIVPESTGGKGGTLLRLPTAVEAGRGRTRWNSYRFDPSGRCPETVSGSWSTSEGQALVPLPSLHQSAYWP